MSSLSLVWLRRDLRLHDNAALHHALQAGERVQLVFVFDTGVLARFSNLRDRRLSFIAEALAELHAELKRRGGGLLVMHGRAVEILPRLAKALEAQHVFAAEDYEPSTRARDEAVGKHAPL